MHHYPKTITAIITLSHIVHGAMTGRRKQKSKKGSSDEIKLALYWSILMMLIQYVHLSFNVNCSVTA